MTRQTTPNGCILDALSNPSATMAVLTIKNLPDPLYDRLKARARVRGRSLNREAILAIETALAEPGPEATTAFLAEAAALRERAAIGAVTTADLDRARRAGRA